MTVPSQVLAEWRDYKSDMLAVGGTVLSIGRMAGVHNRTGKPFDTSYVRV